MIIYAASTPVTLNTEIEESVKALNTAAYKGKLRTVENIIMTKGVAPDYLTMIAACSSGNVDLVLFLFKNFKVARHQLCLHAAIQTDSIILVRFLIEGGFVKLDDQKLRMALRSTMSSSKVGYYLSVKMGKLDRLKKSTKIPEFRDLRDSALNGHIDLVKHLFKYFTNENDRMILVLQDAITSGNLQLVEYVVHETRLEPDIVSLNLACISGYSEIAKFIMKKIKPDRSTLSYAINGGNMDLVWHLILDKWVIPDFNQINLIMTKFN